MILYRCLVVKERRKEIIEVSILLRYNNTQMEKKKTYVKREEIEDKGIIKEDSEKAEEHVIHSRSKDHNLTYK